ncbi:MAG TPA: branched-chain amino acid ABC transporter permease [Chloroflexota bacterium]|nr:branched-chain amino acid ABC transporter permease [Chloroflexota bacterium]HUM71988.1 branched-chain amino acid ABC transporter permease [Chloroflexota bacterium]
MDKQTKRLRNLFVIIGVAVLVVWLIRPYTNWILVPQQIITGILNGGTLALIALGIVLIYKASEVFNFAAGQMVMIGAYLVWWFAGGPGENAPVSLPLWAAILAGMFVAVLMGFLIERVALRPMTGQPLLAIILMTLGLAQIMQGLTTVLFGVTPKGNFPAPFSPSDVFNIPIAPINDVSIVFLNRLQLGHARLATFIVALLAAAVFVAFFNYTRTGLSMRATSENHELAQSVGIKVSRVFGLSWAIAGVIATLGGVLLATLSGVSVSLAYVALAAFPAILLGGLESFLGAIVGGLLVGLTVALVQTSTIVEVRNSAEIAPYVLLLIVLLIRPEGLFGQKRIERI